MEILFIQLDNFETHIPIISLRCISAKVCISDILNINMCREEKIMGGGGKPHFLKKWFSGEITVKQQQKCYFTYS